MSIATNLGAFATVPKTRLSRISGLLRPTHEHTAISAAMLLVSALCVSRLLGYVREAYIAGVFGAGAYTDAYVAAFTLPDTLSYTLAARRFGIASLAFGVVAGLFIGPFFLNAICARRTGFHFRPSLDIHNPAFREWVRLSVPLGLGISILMADSLYQRYFASGSPGDISRLYYARQLFTVPLGILGQTAGQASLPFFARLFGERRTQEFEATVNKAVTGIFTLSVLCTAWFTGAALPVVDLVYRRGRFQFSDSQQTAVYLFCFSLALGFWAIQVLYARAFFATGDSLTPMVASTMVTVAAFPIYAVMFRMFSVIGLVIASDIAIVLDTTVLAVLLHRRRLVRLTELCWREIGKVITVASLAGVTAWGASHAIPLHGSRKDDLVALGLISLAWGGTALLGIWLTGSQLLDYLKPARRTVSSLPSPGDSTPLEDAIA